MVPGGTAEAGRRTCRGTSSFTIFCQTAVCSSGRDLRANSEILGDLPGEAAPSATFPTSTFVGRGPGSASGDTFSSTSWVKESGAGMYLRPRMARSHKLGRLGPQCQYSGGAALPDGNFAGWDLDPGPDPQGNSPSFRPDPGEPRPVETPGHRSEGELMGFFPDSRRIWFMTENHLVASDGVPGFKTSTGGDAPRHHARGGRGTGALLATGSSFCGQPGDVHWYFYSMEVGEAHRSSDFFPARAHGPAGRKAALCPQPTRASARGNGRYHAGLPPRSADRTPRALEGDPRPSIRLPAEPSAGSCFRADGKICVYTHHRYSSELFLAEGSGGEAPAAASAISVPLWRRSRPLLGELPRRSPCPRAALPSDRERGGDGHGR